MSNLPTVMKSAFQDEEGVVRGYMDTVDFQYELGAACGGNKVYPSVEDLKRHNKCWEECGIVEVEVRAVRVLHAEMPIAQQIARAEARQVKKD